MAVIFMVDRTSVVSESCRNTRGCGVGRDCRWKESTREPMVKIVNRVVSDWFPERPRAAE